MAITRLGLSGTPRSALTISAKTPANYPATGLLVEEFDIWQEGYDRAQVSVYYAGTTTLMPIYSDPGLSVQIVNPQILSSMIDSSGRRYGKFATQVYTPFAYQLDIDNSEQTGVKYVPLFTIAGKDASLAYVKTEGGSTNRDLKDRFADIIHVADYGTIGLSPSSNSSTINSAISAAESAGGGIVMLPAGGIPFTTLNVPAGIYLTGRGKDVTVLQSTVATHAITFTGDTGGLTALTVDGVSVVSSSVGIYALNKDNIQLVDVKIKRFDVNIDWRGGLHFTAYNTDATGGRINARFRGDLNSAGGGGGGEFTGLHWINGEISESTGTGVELYVNDAAVLNNTFRNVDFKSNVGADSALKLYGAQRTMLDNCNFTGNVINFDIQDNPDVAVAEETRKVSGLYFYGGRINGGNMKFNGLCDDVEMADMLFESATFTLSTPTNSIVLRDCKEIDSTISGEATKLLRFSSRSNGSARVVTTNATATTIWRARLEPNKIMLIDVLVTGERRNGTDYGVWHTTHAAKGAVATLAYDNQTANYTAGNKIIGATSGASAYIVADSDAGTTGTLSLSHVEGTFLDNEIIAEDGASGSAQANGVLVEGSAALIGSLTELHQAGSNAGSHPTGWDVTLAVTGQEVLVQVTGASSNTIQWEAKVNTVYRD